MKCFLGAFLANHFRPIEVYKDKFFGHIFMKTDFGNMFAIPEYRKIPVLFGSRFRLSPQEILSLSKVSCFSLFLSQE